MKRFLLPILFAIAVSTALADPPDEDVLRPHLTGKSRWFYELDAGVNFNLLSGNPDYRARNELEGISNVFEQGTGISPLVGFTVGYELNPHIALAFRADYDPRWNSNSSTVSDTCLLRDPLDPTMVVGRSPIDVMKSYDVDITYLSLSLQARITFRRLFIYLGPSVSIPFSAKTSETDRIVDDSSSCSYAPLDPRAPKTTSATLSGSSSTAMRVALRLGLGYNIAIGEHWALVPQVGLDVGLSNTFAADQRLQFQTEPAPSTVTGNAAINPAVRLSALQATIGIQYHL